MVALQLPRLGALPDSRPAVLGGRRAASAALTAESVSSWVPWPTPSPSRPAKATLYERYDGDWTRCVACGHRCPIPDGAQGVCKVRFNRDGRLMVPWGYVAGAQCDPIEKKPFFHALSRRRAPSASACWAATSTAATARTGSPRRRCATPRPRSQSEPATPERLVRAARPSSARASIVSTYNEPLITAEWAVEVFRQAKAAGLATGFVSNGNGTPEVLRLPAALGRPLQGRPEELRRQALPAAGRPPPADPRHDRARCTASGCWVEIVTLLVPGFNDSDEELRRLTGVRRRRVAVDPLARDRVPRGLPDERQRGRRRPRCCSGRRTIGREAGLQFVYAGNMPGSRRRPRGHALPVVPRDADRTPRLPRAATTA